MKEVLSANLEKALVLGKLLVYSKTHLRCTDIKN